MKTLYCISMLALSMAAQAEPTALFTGAFALSNWTITQQGGSIVTALAPASVRLVGANDDRGPSEQNMTIAAPTAGTVGFNWSYATSDSAPVWDAFGFLLNGSFIPVSDDLADVVQQGSFSFVVQAGDVFGFSAFSFDSSNGAASTNISAFRFNPVSAPVPEPSTWALGALGLAAVAAWGRANRTRRSKEHA